MKKIAIIGVGSIGTNLVTQLMKDSKNKFQVAIFDKNSEFLEGKFLDLQILYTINHNKSFISVGKSLEETVNNAEVIIITAGKPKTVGMTREDLLLINKDIIESIAEIIGKIAPNAFVINISNPLDLINYYFIKKSKMNSKKVLGMAGILDSARFNFFLSQEMNIDSNNLQAHIIGSHNDNMLIARNSIKLNGKILKINENILENILEKTRKTGAKIGELCGASAFASPASGALKMAYSYLFDLKEEISCSYMLNGNEGYEYKDISIGVPVVIGLEGVEKIIKLELNEMEKTQFTKCVNGLQNLML